MDKQDAVHFVPASRYVIVHVSLEYYSTLKRKGILTLAQMDEPYRHYAAFQNKLVTEGQILYDSS